MPPTTNDKSDTTAEKWQMLSPFDGYVFGAYRVVREIFNQVRAEMGIPRKHQKGKP